MADNKNEILLESGTNEIEIMQFTVYGELYGINVAKVKEIMMSDKVKPMPHVHPAVEGIYKPRGTMVTVVDLPYYLTNKPTEHNARDLFIVTHFNKMYIAFRVHSVVEISRISWTDIRKPDSSITGGEDGVATGIAQCGDQLVTILDFEKIVADIAPETGIQMDEIDRLGKRPDTNVPIIMAEDSVLLTKMIESSLHKAGYVNIRAFNNGEEAWEYLSSIRDAKYLKDKVQLIITDIEMPKMDGHRLTKLV
ncbi:MAG: chemotaxis protein, partial [Hungatella sp.]